jgi:hypothetical protein
MQSMWCDSWRSTNARQVFYISRPVPSAGHPWDYTGENVVIRQKPGCANLAERVGTISCSVEAGLRIPDAKNLDVAWGCTSQQDEIVVSEAIDQSCRPGSPMFHVKHPPQCITSPPSTVKIWPVM